MRPEATIQAERQKLERLSYVLARTLEEHGSDISKEMHDLSVSVFEDASELLDKKLDDLTPYQRMSKTLSAVYTQVLLEIATKISHVTPYVN